MYKLIKMEQLLVKRIHPDAILPERKSKDAAGYDLYSVCDKEIVKQNLIPTGICVAIPKGYYGRVAPRSGLAVRYGINVGAGVIDSDYRGEIKVLLFNHSDIPVLIKKRDAIAQLIIEKIATPDVREVEELDATERGSNGFGSTDQK